MPPLGYRPGPCSYTGPLNHIANCVQAGANLRQSATKLWGMYFEDEPGAAAKLLSKDEARRIAANITKLPELPNSKETRKS